MPPSRPLPPDPAAVGYGALAAQMDFDADLSIYRRFGALQARTILYLQAEISSLEKHLLELDQEADANPDLGAKESTQSWSSMQKNGGERLEIAMQIRQKLKEYNKLLQAQSWLQSLKPPEEGARKGLQNLVNSRSYVLRTEAGFLSEDKKLDLVALVPREEREVLSKFLEKRAFRLFQTKADRTHHVTSNLEVFSHTRIRTFVRLLTILTSTLLPVLSIVVLYYIRSQPTRLGCIVLFTGFCSVVLALISNARNVEIMSVAAAYAAVQVVFVSGNLGGPAGS